MKLLKYFLVLLLSVAVFSCEEDPVLREGGEDDDDPIVNPPPPPPPPPNPAKATVVLDSLETT